MTHEISRRTMIGGALAGSASVLSACNGGIDPLTTSGLTSHVPRPSIGVDANLSTSAAMYAPLQDGEFHLAAIPYDQMETRFRRQRVVNNTGMPPKTLVVDPRNHHAYYIISNDEAVRYGVGVGKAGFEWSGDAIIGRKAKWPTWTPPREMVERSPQLQKYAGGMPGGIKNPLGARALYLFEGGRDTLFRLHGSPEWQSIGKSMSSGCIRFLNQDIIDLYQRVPNGTKVRVLGA